MSTVVIKGKEYALGDLSFSEENVTLFEMLLNMDNARSLPIASFRRALREALENGCGADKAEEAMSGLKMDFRQGSDLLNAFEALGKSLGGE